MVRTRAHKYQPRPARATSTLTGPRGKKSVSPKYRVLGLLLAMVGVLAIAAFLLYSVTHAPASDRPRVLIDADRERYEHMKLTGQYK